ncbi:hypothetical protein HETIRDRAFT_309625 [Heterobasidion irregulare TC 32-1]|uniref:V-type proton ATPase subunit a n=1 Tax=Heterobasidion irregulare (strain TC 32-1) TaxID=747525 RepID=W4KJS8_HETIT|nr:uncharacterized protein HETIRDRAFT_309625 [Heterobasidion irregulare TC 32-1]ETW85286.1 hypothetical protein HETIRDRAFT_309625 [Heterobasidion irregulare TC 32-1]
MGTPVVNEYPSLFPTEVAHDTVAELGELENMQFKDPNPNVNPFQRSFIGEIRRIDEMARRVLFSLLKLRGKKIRYPCARCMIRRLSSPLVREQLKQWTA